MWCHEKGVVIGTGTGTGMPHFRKKWSQLRIGPYPFSPNRVGRRNTTAHHPRERARRVLHWLCWLDVSRPGKPPQVMKMIAQRELFIYMFYSDLLTQVLPCPLLLRWLLLASWRSTSLTETILEALADVLHITAGRSLGSLYLQRNHTIDRWWSVWYSVMMCDDMWWRFVDSMQFIVHSMDCTCERQRSRQLFHEQHVDSHWVCLNYRAANLPVSLWNTSLLSPYRRFG